MPDLAPASPTRRILQILKLFFSPVGRIGPGPYWLGLLVLSLAGFAVAVAFGMPLAPPFGAPKGEAFFRWLNYGQMLWAAIFLHTPGPGLGIDCGLDRQCSHQGSWIGFEVTVVFCLIAFCLQAKRLHDAGHTALWPITFALFEFLAPFGLGLLTNLLFPSHGLDSLIFGIGAGIFVGFVPPVIFKLWVGFARRVPEANEHGVHPGRWGVTWPERRRLTLRR